MATMLKEANDRQKVKISGKNIFKCTEPSLPVERVENIFLQF